MEISFIVRSLSVFLNSVGNFYRVLLLLSVERRSYFTSHEVYTQSVLPSGIITL